MNNNKPSGKPQITTIVGEKMKKNLKNHETTGLYFLLHFVRVYCLATFDKCCPKNVK